MDSVIYKICSTELWQEARKKGVFEGAPVDLADGFIHFSTAGQLTGTAAKHFAGQKDLVLLAIDTAGIAEHLEYEVSRGGALFPHLYAAMPIDAVIWEKELPSDKDGNPVIPELDP